MAPRYSSPLIPVRLVHPACRRWSIDCTISTRPNIALGLLVTRPSRRRRDHRSCRMASLHSPPGWAQTPAHAVFYSRSQTSRVPARLLVKGKSRRLHLLSCHRRVALAARVDERPGRSAAAGFYMRKAKRPGLPRQAASGCLAFTKPSSSTARAPIPHGRPPCPPFRSALVCWRTYNRVLPKDLHMSSSEPDLPEAHQVAHPRRGDRSDPTIDAWMERIRSYTTSSRMRTTVLAIVEPSSAPQLRRSFS